MVPKWPILASIALKKNLKNTNKAISLHIFIRISITSILLAWLITGCQPKTSDWAAQYPHTQNGSFAASVSSSGNYAVVSSLYHGVSLWDLNSNGAIYNWYQTPKDQPFSLFNDGDTNAQADNNFVFATAIAPDDSHAVLADKTNFSLWDIKTGQNQGYWQVRQSKVVYRTKTINGATKQLSIYDVVDENKCLNPSSEKNEHCVVVGNIRAIDVSNEGKHILIGKSNGVVVHINTTTGRRLEFLGHQQVLFDDEQKPFHINNAINSVALSPNGLYALSGSSDQSAYLWSTKTGQVIYKFQHHNRVVQVALDAQARFAFTADTGSQASIWDLTTGNLVSQLQYVNRQEVFSFARFSHNGKMLVTGAPTRKLSLWDVQTGKQIKEWLVSPRKNSRPASAVVYSAAFINNDTQITSESSSGLNEVWDIK
ncbi:MAG: WD40 repeat protein [Psychrosphaera sp.]